nr:FAD:protein FMN transferase [Lachnospiraceae bacterium]
MKHLSFTNYIRRATVFFSAILFLSFCLTGCGHQKQAYSQTAFCFDTAVTITIYDSASRESEANDLLSKTISLCQDYDNMFSRTIEGSDIYRINHASGEWTVVSDETISLLQSALEYCEMTDGAIDITIAPVKDLWDFSGNENIKMPATADIEEKLTHVDYSLIEIEGSKVRLPDPESAIDLGFIAKGYIADQIRAFLLENDVKSALINLGGNIAVIGEKPDGSPFTIGIQKPFAPAGTYCSTVSASQAGNGASSVVTSGIYERCFEYNGKLYHHILDCETGKPVQTDLAGVTIITDSSLHADALSTTCLLIGLDRGVSYIRELDGVEAVFVTTDGKIIDTRE